MKTLYLDLSMGAAGDMLTAALYELLDEDSKKSFMDKINSLGLEGVTCEAKSCQKCGITGTCMDVRVKGIAEHENHEHEHEHEHHHHGHDHHHDHEHHHSSVHEIENIINDLPLDEAIRSNIKDIYMLIADAESRAHGCPVSDIHFHEVGTMDAMADVASVCIIMAMLSPQRVVASPVCTGFGKVRCAHGILPVPAPATANLLEGIPVYAGNIEAELCTPTGAAILRHFVKEYSQMPVMTVSAIGYGMGIKDFPAANCVRAFLGESDDIVSAGRMEDITELSCNIDDMTAEEIGHATSLFLEEGAADVYTTAIGMKRSRPAVKITVMCHPDEKEKFVSLMFKNTTTLGIRENVFRRYFLDRKIEEFSGIFGTVHKKTSEGYGIIRSKYEYADVSRIAKERGISFEQAVHLIDKELYDR